MRVIAGIAKGRKLTSVPGDATRPITDRVKENLFNILAVRVVDARFLDLFAGTGSVGIEALSRGAREAVFVEISDKAADVLRRNLELTGFTDYAQIMQDDVFRYLEREPSEPFDVVYVAPPQYRGLWSRTLRNLDGRGFLAPGGLAVTQLFPKEYEELGLETLELVDRREYGSTLLCFYRRVVE